jgi:arabinofuranosyltransferase
MPDTQSSDPSPSTLRRVLGAIAALAYLVVLVRTAWISDDAAITLRTVLNVTHGFGLTFNIGERVQTYTHPLWMGLLTAGYFVAGNVFVVTFAATMICSVMAFWIAVTHAASRIQAGVAVLLLLFSQAFVDFSTSGLENPLANLLVAGFVTLFLNDTIGRRRWLTGLWGLGALLYLTRPDLVLLVLPLLLLASWRVRRPGVVAAAVLIGTLPASAWTIFALIYYGFPFPNTAYAKLAMGIDPGELRTQGLLYLFDSIDRDPLTLTTIAFAVVMAIAQRSAAGRALAAGIAIYLVYIVSIGGDFMAGRFLAVPFFAAVLVVTRLSTGSKALWVPSAAVLALVGTAGVHLPIWSNSRFDDAAPKPSGVVDERAVYFHDRSLLLAKRGTFRDPDWPSARRAPGPIGVLNTCGLMGAAGLEFGPYIHLLDECALADPLLARLPAVFNPEWRTGHYRRMIPGGYKESLESSSNRIQDPGLREYYEQLRLITRAERLFSSERLRAIAAMNTGRYDHLIDSRYYRHSGSIASLEQLAALRQPGTPGAAEGNHVLTLPLAVTVPVRAGRRYADLTLDSDDRYILTFLKNDRTLSRLELGPIPPHRRQPGLAAYTVDVPPRARAQGFDTLVVAPAGGDEHYALGHLLLEGSPATDWELYRRVAVRDGVATAR